MNILGLTGGVGMGKSAVEGILRSWGIRTIDTDVLSKQLVEPGQPALEEIRILFGDSVLNGNDQLERSRLAEIVFENDSARKALEKILHPRIRAGWTAELENLRIQRVATAVVIIPLLFETGAESEFDRTLCIACSAKSQQTRLKKRYWSDHQIQQRIAAQWPIEKKMLKADYVIWNEGSMNVTAEQLRRVIG